MANRYDLAEYLYGLDAIITSKTDAGQPRDGWLAREYERAYEQLKQIVKENSDDEAGQSDIPRQRAEA